MVGAGGTRTCIVSRPLYHCATDADKVSLVFICENYLFFKSVVHLGLHRDFSCLQVCFCFVLFCFLLLDMKMLNKLYVFLSTACVSVPLLITVLIPSWQNVLTQYSTRCKCLYDVLIEYEASTKISYVGRILINTIVQCYRILTDHYAMLLTDHYTNRPLCIMLWNICSLRVQMCQFYPIKSFFGNVEIY